MQELRAFAPLYRGSIPDGLAGTLHASVTMAATDAAQASPVLPGTNGVNAISQIQIANKSTSWAHVNFGIFGAVVAATVASSYPVAPGSVVVVSVDPEVTGASVILATAAATGDVVFTRGGGL